MNRHRRAAVLSGLALGLASLVGRAVGAALPVEVWKPRSCGCCAEWVKHEERDRRDAYDVQLVLRGGSTRVYQSYR